MSRMANTGYVPILIVAQDENDKYIHIKDAKENINYFCPCCHQPVKMRAKSSKKVQPHFYHITESPCVNSETLIHWTYKNWLFSEGSLFTIKDDDQIYIVKNIEIEKNHKTKFGIYCPDITVIDTTGKRFFFEINYSNKKKYSNYADRWCELNSPVVEINVKDLINSSFTDDIPEFDLLFEDGKYYGRLYDKNDKDVYLELEKRKKNIIESKKRDLEYVNKLDSVWKYTQLYVKHEIAEDDFFVLSCFEDLHFDDQHFFASIVKRIKCVDLENILAKHISSNYVSKIEDEAIRILNLENDFQVSVKELNSSKFIIHLNLYIKNNGITLSFPDYKKLKKYANGLPVSIDETILTEDKKMLKRYKSVSEKFFTGVNYLKNHEYKYINAFFEFPTLITVENSRFNVKIESSFFDKENGEFINPLLLNSKIIFRDEICFTNNIDWTMDKIQYIDDRYGVLKSIKDLRYMVSHDEEIRHKIKNINYKLRLLEQKYNLNENNIRFKVDEFTSYSANVAFTYNHFIISKIHFEDTPIDIDMFKSAIDMTFKNFEKRFLELMKNDAFNQFSIICSDINCASNDLWTAEIISSSTDISMHFEFNDVVLQKCISDIEKQESFMLSMDFKWIMRNLTHDKLDVDIPLISSHLFNFEKDTVVENTFYYQDDENNQNPLISWKQYIAKELSGHIRTINESRIPIWFIEKYTKERC